MKHNSETIHDSFTEFKYSSFSEFKYFDAAHSKRTGSFQRTINNKLSVTLLT